MEWGVGSVGGGCHWVARGAEGAGKGCEQPALPLASVPPPPHPRTHIHTHTQYCKISKSHHLRRTAPLHRVDLAAVTAQDKPRLEVVLVRGGPTHFFPPKALAVVSLNNTHDKSRGPQNCRVQHPLTQTYVACDAGPRTAEAWPLCAPGGARGQPRQVERVVPHSRQSMAVTTTQHTTPHPASRTPSHTHQHSDLLLFQGGNLALKIHHLGFHGSQPLLQSHHSQLSKRRKDGQAPGNARSAAAPALLRRVGGGAAGTCRPK
jgi:hypothetical protein